ncbi:MAG: RAD55 family ATPase, partial [Pyrobaculum sp.]
MGFKTGVGPLDEQMPNGLPPGYVVLIEGFLGTGKSFIATTIASTAAKNGAPVLFFSIDALSDEVFEDLTKRGAAVGLITIVDGFSAPNERFSKLKPPSRHKLDTPDVYIFINKLAEFANDFKKGVVVVDSINELLMRSPGSVLDLFRALKIFAKFTESVVVVTAHTDVEEVHGVLTTAEHLADVIIQIEVDPNLE